MTKLRIVCIHLMGVLFLLAACATAKQAKLDSVVPERALSEVETLKNKIEKDHVDVLAHDSYAEGVNDLKDARDEMSESDPENDEVLEELAEAKWHFQQAEQEAKTVVNVPESVLEARSNILAVGISANPELRERMQDIDDELIDESDNFEKSLKANQVSYFQKEYLKIEVAAVQDKHLGTFRKIVDNSLDQDAEDLAPATLDQTRKDIAVAENLIQQSPRQPSEFEKSVEEANRSAKLLSDVMSKLTGVAEGSSESVALRLVRQEREVGALTDTVDVLKMGLVETTKNLQSTKENLYERNIDYLNAQNKVSFQEAMNSVRDNFTNEEAEVYQQGRSLIIRLKKINFAFGSAKIPEQSTALLDKVSDIISEINPKNVIIQGHTDSTGEEAYNKELSTSRAKSVAEYFSDKGATIEFKPKGFGETQPIANNETKKGRQLNRRVDIVINADDQTNPRNLSSNP